MNKLVPRLAVFSLLAGVTALIACEQLPSEPATNVLAIPAIDVADEVAPAPLLNYMNGPEMPGNSPVERWAGGGWISVTDPDKGLRARLYDTFNTIRCGGSADDPDWWDYQDIWSNPDGILKSHWQANEVPIVVYPWPNTPGKDFCDFLAEDYLAVGTGTAVANDNNVFWFTGTGGNNSYGILVKGTVEDGDGNTYNVVGRNHYTVRGLCCEGFVDPTDIWVEEMSTIETIKIHPIRNGHN